MIDNNLSNPRQPDCVRMLCVDDPAVKLYQQTGELVSAWSNKSGIKVEVVVLPWEKYPDKVFSTLQSGSDEFDIVMLPGYFWLPKFAANNWLIPLAGLMSTNLTDWQNYDYGDILPGMRKELEIDGKTYLLPSFSEVQMVYYRKDLLQKAGFANLESPISLEKWLDIAKSIHDPANGVFGTHFKGAASESMVEWLPFLTAVGGNLPESENITFFPENEGVLSLKKLITYLPYCREDVGKSDNATMFELLSTGKVGIVNHWSGQVGPLIDRSVNPYADQYGFASLENPWGTVWAFGIPSASKKKNGAFSCLLHLTNASADLQQAEYSGSPVRRSSLKNPYALRKYPWFPALLDCIEKKKTFPSSAGFSDLMGDLYTMTHEVFSNNQTPVEAVQMLNHKLELE